MDKKIDFCSHFKNDCAAFVQWKRSLGYIYDTEALMLKRIDRFLCERYPDATILSSSIVNDWCRKRDNEHPRTHCSRIRCIKQFAKYLLSHGVDAFIPDLPSESKARRMFRAHIYTSKELHMLFSYFDSIDPVEHPLRSLQWPVLFRLFYSSGLRSREARSLKIDDFNSQKGTIVVRKSKFGKSRVIPLHPNMTDRLSAYLEALPEYLRKAGLVFPNEKGREYGRHVFFAALMKAADAVGIPHSGKSRGIRVHDFRHTFAVRTMRNAFEAGRNTTAFLPYLSAYMGHVDLRGTEVYLQMTPESFPEISRRFSESFGNLVPKEV